MESRLGVASAITRPIHPVELDAAPMEHLRRRILALGNTFSAADCAKNLSLIRSISSPEFVLRAIQEVMSRDRLLRQIASISYRHVSHFDKIVLVDAQIPNGYRLTAHLWTPPYAKYELDDELIHDHRFSFWSAILTGEMRAQVFKPNAGSAVFQHYQYTPENRAAENFYAFEGVTQLKACEVTAKPAGTAYYLSFDTIHKVILPRTELSCTLVLRSPRARNYSNVFNTTYPTTDTRVSNVMFTPSELFGRLARLYTAIEGTRLSRPRLLREPPQPQAARS
jgi:hypothetical protein